MNMLIYVNILILLFGVVHASNIFEKRYFILNNGLVYSLVKIVIIGRKKMHKIDKSKQAMYVTYRYRIWFMIYTFILAITTF